jgi:hypothetical protein
VSEGGETKTAIGIMDLGKRAQLITYQEEKKRKEGGTKEGEKKGIREEEKRRRPQQRNQALQQLRAHKQSLGLASKRSLKNPRAKPSCIS